MTVSDSLKMGGASIPIRLAQQQVSARIRDTNFYYSQLLDNLLPSKVRDSSFFFRAFLEDFLHYCRAEDFFLGH